MKTDILQAIRNRRLFFDGAMGTVLIERGLISGGERPEIVNITNPDAVEQLHSEYLSVGCDIITTNTFGVNPLAYDNYEELIYKACECARKAIAPYHDKYIAFDIGPTGHMLQPAGDLSYEDCIEAYAKVARLAEKCGADLILIETMSDPGETKAALLASKENSSLPVFVSNVYDNNGKMSSGGDIDSMVALAEGLGAAAIGVNCGFGPHDMLGIIERFSQISSTPIICSSNAGLPHLCGNEAYYDIDEDDFAAAARQLALCGAHIIGGCCGTNPEYMKRTIVHLQDVPYSPPTPKNKTVISSYSHALYIGKRPILIGERINPTGKPRLKEALRTHDISYILREAVSQAEAGVHALDVNVGLPDIDEANMMEEVVRELQSITDLPLQIDSSSPEAIERALRVYRGIALVNSVNGKSESLDSILPSVARYGGVVIALTLDENGIPATASGRVAIAEHIISRCADYGISASRVIVDPLALAVSSEPLSAQVTLEALRTLHAMGIRTSLGVSNISFGLPKRNLINSSFFSLALANGLDCAIMNPFSQDMMSAYHAHGVLYAIDEACSEYINYASSLPDDTTSNAKTPVATAVEPTSSGKMTPNSADINTGSNSDNDLLKAAVRRGLKKDAVSICSALPDDISIIDVINTAILPALNEIGDAFGNKKAFLPQLLMSADAATAAIEVLKARRKPSELAASQSESARTVILATVKGDIHDIGKNIVKMLLESYGFTVIDLGRDVPPETVRDCAVSSGCRLVGLSALMTTTVGAMEETIRLLHETDEAIQIVVGGAVLNEEYAAMIKADYYAKDAMDTVRYAERYYNT